VPPGYKDKGKTDEQAAGDYLVWAQLLREAKTRRSDVLFVTGDVKEDWWRQERGQTRGPRLELVAELRAVAGTNLYMLRPENLLRRAKTALQVEVDPASVEDVERVDRSLSLDGHGGWSREAVSTLLDDLSFRAPVQCAAIRFAADNGGFVSREEVYELGGYDENRTLKGFTRPANRLAQEMRSSGILPEGTVDVLEPVYDPASGTGQVSGFAVAQQLVPLIQEWGAQAD
jgi:hypothetical protein